MLTTRGITAQPGVALVDRQRNPNSLEYIANAVSGSMQGKVMNSADFAAMISGLEAQGVTRPEIVRRTGLSKNTIWRLASQEAREPKFDTVQKVLDLKARVDRVIRTG